MVFGFKTNRKTGGKFIPRPNKGKRISQTFGLKKNEHLTMDQINKILMERHIDPEDIIFEEDAVNKNFEGRKLSLNPNNELIDNIIVAVDSPHRYDEIDLVNNPKLAEKEEARVREVKGIKDETEPEREMVEKQEGKKKKGKDDD